MGSTNQNGKDLNIVKAPWNLKGKGYIFLYNFTKKFVMENCFVDEKLKSNFVCGFGAVMIVDYSSSNAGPYRELLIIPGKFKINNKVRYTISKIYVSSYTSVYSGRYNWSIPKEYAEFNFKKASYKARENNDENLSFNNSKNIETIIIKKDEKEFFNAEIKNYEFKFPVSTIFLPFPIFQINENKVYYTKFNGYGIGNFCKIENLNIDKDLFPDISSQSLIMGIKVEPFNLVFPEAKIQDWK